MKRSCFPVMGITVALGFMVMACGQAAPAPAPTNPPVAPKAAEPTKAAAPATAPAKAAPTTAPAAQPTSAPAKTSAFPEKGKPITLIVPYAAGGATDTAARLLAADLEKLLGTPVQVVAKPGATSQVGLTELLNSRPDGYTLSAGVISTIVTHFLDPSRQAPYKTARDFTLVAMHHFNPQLIAVKADSPWKTTKELLDYAKSNPEKVRYSTSGLLSTTHLTGLMLEKAGAATLAPVHFSGGAESVPALLGGNVEALAAAVTDVVPHVKSGTVRVLGVADSQPSPFLPGVTTFQSQGYDVNLVSATGVVGPPGMPKDVLDTLTNSIKRVLEMEEQKKKMSDLGFDVRYMNPEDYARLWADTETRVTPLIKATLEQQKK